jgi:hypothetical protein
MPALHRINVRPDRSVPWATLVCATIIRFAGGALSRVPLSGPCCDGRTRIMLHHFNGLEPCSAAGRCLPHSAFARQARFDGNSPPEEKLEASEEWGEGSWQQWAKLTDDDAELIPG